MAADPMLIANGWVGGSSAARMDLARNSAGQNATVGE